MANFRTDRFVLSGREMQMNQLQSQFTVAMTERPQLVFVIGDAGKGKTSLVREFCRQAQVANNQVVVAWGQCYMPRGFGTPYLPFQEILALLGGTTDVIVRRSISAANTRRLKRLGRFTLRAITS